MDPSSDGLRSPVLPVHEKLVRSNLAAEPDPRNSLCSDQAEDLRSLEGVLE